ncbi:uncharacterized protein LOC127836267 [Dreissena polymorpha]|uniref:THD domain-containing protein n=1 Tax=Dreissena polymorpha TaxID=45954 RepID=A0A9D4G0G2_DREPO|nr:uncharacterized protein LOC127836267 [Dreissena polymorpha]XP_052218723.1 uncharacterized protein LOC127836267 [Dreissena polymorpha]XP_052218725.1 uncharacterized protein LOC127836267 [Dreissena polymorpha]XP_052218726.1 uncharacterized protein LOC127836267 [Dreissena polymorpha]XP_052218727.1 uncharacterized protein LOC127836267 [Dreissena polymorpha]KAH3808404.1 hypothetical protein DPMN_136757 [Dreissena polymorpha]
MSMDLNKTLPDVCCTCTVLQQSILNKDIEGRACNTIFSLNENVPSAQTFPTQSRISDCHVSNGLPVKKKRAILRSRDSLYSHQRRFSANEGTKTTDRGNIVSRLSVVIIALIAGLCCVVSFAALILQIRQQSVITKLQTTTENLRIAVTQSEGNNRLCLPCAELLLEPFSADTSELGDLMKHEEKGQGICCAKLVTQISVLFNLFAKRKQMERCSTETKSSYTCNASDTVTAGSPSFSANGNSFGNISAHLQAGTQPVNKETDAQIRNWSFGPVAPGTHLTNIRLSSDNRSLVIPESGRYFLYSQVGLLIYYNPEAPLEFPSPSQSLIHVVYRYNMIYPTSHEELLRSDVTQCWEQKKDYGRYTSYVGASVLLNKGDLVYVKVSKIEFLSKSDFGVTYFGLFKLG